MPRFVILAHDWPCAHWDFLVEAGPVLRAWRLLEVPRSGARVCARNRTPITARCTWITKAR
jgi:hypothetical protein